MAKVDGRRRHRTVDQRVKQRTGLMMAMGKNPYQASEMLDLYLGGDSVSEIARAYNVTMGSVYSCISKEALFRLMRQRAAEQLEEVEEILNGDSQ